MTRKKLLIHVGMGKTGTTALQEFFWANRNLLAEKGVCYPKVGVVSGAHHLLSPHVPPFLADMGTYLKPEEWAPAIAAEDSETVLLSSELMAWAAPELVQEFCASLQRWFDLRILFYFRRQDSQIMAAYNQQVKAGTQIRPIQDVITRQMERFDYLAKIAPWRDQVGTENVSVRPFERGQFHEGDIRKDFLLHFLGIDETSEFRFPTGNSNPRLSKQAMEFKRMTNLVAPDPEFLSRLNDALLDYSSRTSEDSTAIFSNQPTLSPAERRKIIEASEEVNRTIASRYMQRDDQILFRDSLPADDPDWSGTTSAEDAFPEILQFLAQIDPGADRSLATFLEAGLKSENKPLRLAAEVLDRARQESTSLPKVAVQKPIIPQSIRSRARRFAGRIYRRISASLRG